MSREKEVWDAIAEVSDMIYDVDQKVDKLMRKVYPEFFSENQNVENFTDKSDFIHKDIIRKKIEELNKMNERIAYRDDFSDRDCDIYHDNWIKIQAYKELLVEDKPNPVLVDNAMKIDKNGKVTNFQDYYDEY